MKSNDRAHVLKLYELFKSRDMDGIFKLLHTDVEWVNGPKNEHSHGLDELRALWTRQWAAVDIKLEPVNITPTGNGLLVEVAETVTAHDGKLLFEGSVGHAYTLRSGLIARCDIVDV